MGLNPNQQDQKKFLAELVGKIKQLPLLPSVVMRMITLAPDDPAYFDKIVKLAHEDPAFSTRLIQVANSAGMRPAAPITTLQHAVARLGSRQVAGLVTSMSVASVFIPATQAQRNLWIHAVQVAHGARAIAISNTNLQVDPHEAYLCGLLHDIGRFVMFEFAPRELERIDETQWKTPIELVKAEKAVTGFDHAGLGWLACKKWCLPDLITQLVKHHHVYSPPRGNREEIRFANLVNTIQEADFLSIQLMLHPEALELPGNALAQMLRESCIHRDWAQPPLAAADLARLAAPVKADADQAVEALGLA